MCKVCKLFPTMGKSRKKKPDEKPADERSRSRSPMRKDPRSSESSDSDAVDVDQAMQKEADKYKPYKAPGYARKYDENCKKSDYIVFLSHNDEDKHFTDQDRLAISKGIRKHCVSGIIHLKPINKYKVGIIFDLPNNANVFLQNDKLLNELSLKASIPAADTEATGVITSVPVELSNKQIFKSLNSSRNIIQVRRFMRRVKNMNGTISFQPTQTVAVTFASTQLPEYVCLDHWRHEVSQYVPPVKQCLRCMVYGHIAKYCKNSEICSICTEKHNFKSCTVDPKNAKCVNCGGNHIAISSLCPEKKKRIEDNKVKSRSVKYSELFNENAFPQLAAKSIEIQINNLTKSNIFMNLITEAVMQLITNQKDVPINNSSIKEIIKSTLSKKSLTNP